MLALCVVFQLFKSIQLVTGPAINLILMISSLYIGLAEGGVLAIFSPVFAFLLAPAPIMQMLPQMLLVVIVGNLTMVTLVWLFREKVLLGLPLAVVSKAVIMWVLSGYVILPLFGNDLSSKMEHAIRAAFSLNQLVTGSIGMLVAFPVWGILKKHKSKLP